MSLTLYASKWCSHFSSKCTRLVDDTGATTVRFEAGAIVTSKPAKSVTTKPVTTLTDKACDTSTSGYLSSSPGFVDSLAACSKSCQASSQCMSITLYGSKWCSHFSSECTRLVDDTGATTVRFEASAQAQAYALAGDGKECDSGAGEVYLSTSPGKGGTLGQCLTSCGQSTSGCKSITFFANGWCSHFSSACTKTKAVTNAVAFSRVDSTTSDKSTSTLTDKACDTSTSGYLSSSPGFVDSLAVCSKSCQASNQCMSLTLYGSKW